jgi:hypothetical protein
MDQQGNESRRAQLRDRYNQIHRKIGEPPKIRRLPFRDKPKLLDAGFERGWLDVEKGCGSVRSSNTPIALFDGLQDDGALGLVE